MIIEHATLTIKEEKLEEFIQAIYSGFAILRNARGYISHKLLQNEECPNRFILIAHWNSLEDHLEGFVGSAAFEQWESIITPFFKCVPTVLHYTEVKYR